MQSIFSQSHTNIDWGDLFKKNVQKEANTKQLVQSKKKQDSGHEEKGQTAGGVKSMYQREDSSTQKQGNQAERTQAIILQKAVYLQKIEKTEGEPICQLHGQPCRLVCKEKQCPTKFVCYSSECLSAHQHSQQLIGLSYIKNKLEQFSDLKQILRKQALTLIESYYEDVADRFIVAVGQAKEKALEALNQICQTFVFPLNQETQAAIQSVQKDLFGSPKEQLLLSWQSMKHGCAQISPDSQISLLLNNIKLKIQNLDNNFKDIGQNMYYKILSLSTGIFQKLDLSFKQQCILQKLLEDKGIHFKKLKLLFSANENNFSAAKFHKCCDYQEKTLTVVRSTNGSLFGGYSSVSFKRNQTWINASDAFLFSVGFQSCAKFKNQRNYYQDHQDLGPIWGYGKDLVINQRCDINYSTSKLSAYLWQKPQITKSSLVEQQTFLVQNYLVFKVA